MKKILLIILLILILVMSNKEDTIVVSNEVDNDEMITVLVYIPGLTTNNFNNYFDDTVEIIGIYPKVNVLYKEKIGDMFYQFNMSNVKKDINNFTKKYKKVLQTNNFTNDLILINYNGIGIEKVKVYISNKNLKLFMINCNNCEYEKTLR